MADPPPAAHVSRQESPWGGGLCECVGNKLARFLRRPDDSVGDVHRKVFWLIFLVCVANVSLLAYLAAQERQQVGEVMGFTIVPLYFSLVAYFVYVKRLTSTQISCFLGVFTVAFFVRMVIYAGVSVEIWFFVLLIMNVLLFIRANRLVLQAFTAIGIVTQIILAVEQSQRFGLMDVPGTLPQEVRRSILCGCDTLPCREPLWIVGPHLFFKVLTTVLVYVLASGFAGGMRKEQENLRRGVEASQYVAQQLADFNLDGAQKYLAQHQDTIPPELLTALDTILSNLATYRPYLPQSILQYRTIDKSVLEALLRTHDAGPVDGGCPHYMVDGAFSQSGVSQSVDASLFDFKMDIAAPSPVHAPQMHTHEREVSLVSFSWRTPRDVVGTEAHVTQHALLTSIVLTVMQQHTGVIDTFTGNSFLCSFNSAFKCERHAAAAVQSMQGVAQMVVPAGITACGAGVTGSAHVGVLGTEAMRRQCIVGPIGLQLQSLEAMQRTRGYQWICCPATYATTYGMGQHDVPMRMLLDTLRDARVDEWGASYGGPRDGAAARMQHVAYELLVDPHEVPDLDLATYNEGCRVFHSTGSIKRACNALDSPALTKAFQAALQHARMISIIVRVEGLVMSVETSVASSSSHDEGSSALAQAVEDNDTFTTPFDAV